MLDHLFNRMATSNSPLLPKLKTIVILQNSAFPEDSHSSLYRISPSIRLLLNAARSRGLSLHLELYDNVRDVELVSAAETRRLRLEEGIFVTATFTKNECSSSDYQFLTHLGTILETVLRCENLSENLPIVEGIIQRTETIAYGLHDWQLPFLKSMDDLQSALCELAHCPTPADIVEETWDSVRARAKAILQWSERDSAIEVSEKQEEETMEVGAQEV
ncbi:hypothetical protein PM082_012618 [Marasmius tenuissimus]|nr:hypothetical protein PM082_012618 [Marasmius tenuissimus]